MKYTMYCIAGTLISLSWIPAVVSSVVKTNGRLVITISPAIFVFIAVNNIFGLWFLVITVFVLSLFWFSNIPEPPRTSSRKLLSRFVARGLE